MTKYIFSFCTLFVLFATQSSCGPNGQGSSSYALISGQLDNLPQQELQLIDLSIGQGKVTDTAYVKEDGSFTFSNPISKPGFYKLQIGQNYQMVLPLHPEDQITISGDASKPQEMKIKGSKDVERMHEFANYNYDVYLKQEALSEEYESLAPESVDEATMQSFQRRHAELDNLKVEKMKKMIDDNPSSMANLAFTEMLDPQNPEHLEYLKKLDESLGEKYSGIVFYDSFHQRMQDIGRLAIGSEVPEISLENPEGKVVPLSSLRGKVVLIDFWASWCRPCRMENPNIVAAYERFKDKGFEIYGVSLDRTKEAWVNAIQADNLHWTQVSDLKFWNSEAAADYGVTGIPFAVLIDKEGKVIAKNLRGQALHQKLAEVLE